MRKAVWSVGLILLMGVTAAAQGRAGAVDTPSAEASVGYSFMRNFAIAGSPGANQHGVSGSLAWNANQWLGVVGDLGVYKVAGLASGFSGHSLSYLLGPRFSYRSNSAVTPFAQALVGGAHLTTSFAGVSTGRDAFAFTVGGGLDVRATDTVAIRLFQGEYLFTHFGNQQQNNMRLSAGVVFRLGGRGR